MCDTPDERSGDGGSNNAGRRAVVACAVLEDELRAIHASLGAPIRVWRWVEPALHERPTMLGEALQRAVQEIERTEPEVEEIVLGIGLCSRGLEGVSAGRCMLIAPRSDDCIGLLLGDPARYRREVAETPGTAWFSRGWVRHGVAPGPERVRRYEEQLAERFKPDEVEYLVEVERAALRAYTRVCFVTLTIAGEGEQDARAAATLAAVEKGWTLGQMTGDPALLTALLAGPHDEHRFCIARPGQCFRLSGDDRIIHACKCEGEGP